MLNVAIIGTGNISPAHINAYLTFPDRCRIIALCDIYPEKAEEKKARFGLSDAKIYDSHTELLRELSGKLDLCSVCTPPFTHSKIAIDALLSGVNVIVEKPMASSLEECDRMLDAEAQSGRTLSVIAQNRFTDPYMKLRRVLDSGLAGRVLHAEIDSYWWRGHCYYDLWWRGAWATEGGGCTLNHAVHHIDMLGWLLGEPERVTAVLSNAAHDRRDAVSERRARRGHKLRDPSRRGTADNPSMRTRTHIGAVARVCVDAASERLPHQKRIARIRALRAL